MLGTLGTVPTLCAMADVCRPCEFRAQIKNVGTRKRSRIRGASARPSAGLRLAGKLSPPLIVVREWDGTVRSAAEIALFPLALWSHIHERLLSEPYWLRSLRTRKPLHSWRANMRLGSRQAGGGDTKEMHR